MKRRELLINDLPLHEGSAGVSTASIGVHPCLIDMFQSVPYFPHLSLFTSGELLYFIYFNREVSNLGLFSSGFGRYVSTHRHVSASPLACFSLSIGMFQPSRS